MNIVVVEDHQDLRELFVQHLRRDGFHVVGVNCGDELDDHLANATVDLLILDLNLPGESGLDIARRMRAAQTSLNIIMLTARTDEQDRVTGLEIGADDYMVKPFSPRELVARIKAVLRRRKPQLTEDKVNVNGLILDPVTHRVTAAGTAIAIGPTEFRLLHFFMTHPERVHSRSQLLDKVWGDHVFVEERTVDVHIRRLRSVLEATDHDSLIQTVRGSGYRFSTHND